VIGGGITSTIETFVPGTPQPTSGGAIATTCYGTLTLAKTGGGTLPALQKTYVTQFIPDAVTPANSKLYNCGRNSVNGKYECYSLAQTAGATWTLVTITPAVTTTTVPLSFLWFIYNKQIFIATDSQAGVLNLAAGTSQPFWDTSANLPKMPSLLATGITKIVWSNKTCLCSEDLLVTLSRAF
jgi:hypothetical protein